MYHPEEDHKVEEEDNYDGTEERSKEDSRVFVEAASFDGRKV